jgi:TolB-like protein/Tfp pilus assembly protein PilF
LDVARAFQATRIKVECRRDERFVKARRVNPKNFFAELKQRNIYKVAITYGVVAWLLLQAASILFPTFEAPSWTTKVFVAVIALGFPMALIIAWAFELTPEGIKRTDDIESGQRSRNRTWIYIVVVGGAISIGLFFLGRFTAPPKQNASNGVSAKSIAVLPFENQSGDPDNAYFADGIQEEIITRLAKIADLKVISRTSTQKYKGAPSNLREISQQLGVSSVLEGSVQKAADQVRISVQLVNALTDSHIWAETYDRKLIDVFQVESDVAQKIAASLEAKLTGREKNDIAIAGTKIPEAYDAFLHARALVNRQSLADLEKVIQFSRRAVEIDPSYAEAWATLAIFEAQKYFFPDRSNAQLTRARTAAENAFRLAPDSADGHNAMGQFYYYCLQDYDRALIELEIAHERVPNDANILSAIALVKRRQGKLDESIEMQQESARLDPLNEDIWVNLGRSYRGARRFDEARAMFDRALTITPNDNVTLTLKAETYLAQGDLDATWQIVGNLELPYPHRGYEAQIEVLTYRRQFDEAITRISSALVSSYNAPRVLVAIGRATLANLHLAKGDRIKAQPLFVQAEQELESLRAGGDNSLSLVGALVQVEARLGHRDEVDTDASSILQRIKKDAWGFAREEEAVARAYTSLGDFDRALPLLQHALATPSNESLTPPFLRLDPFWDPVRNDSRFQKLCGEKATVNPR